MSVQKVLKTDEIYEVLVGYFRSLMFCFYLIEKIKTKKVSFVMVSV